ncbi:MAG: hypothetical protein CMH54_08845 [Myxococcales bacterium]|nr:hypothetical protein [Myxococcales bacterium]|tara:strand:+ start:913 stop:2904 length:1992 start_codon:yes stop_codon:yes gene_type:complete
MNRNTLQIILIFLALLFAGSATADVGPGEDGAPASTASPDKEEQNGEEAVPAPAEKLAPAVGIAPPPPAPAPKPVKVDFDEAAQKALQDAQDAWIDAWNQKPILVSLAQMGDLGSAGDQLSDVLKGRLKALSNKSFSNREWHEYWTKQKSTAGRLGAGYTKKAKAYAKAQPELSATYKARAQSLRRWASLADRKTKNQDKYLKAIETERDAVAERLEAALQAPAAKKTVATKSTVDLSPFAARRQKLAQVRQQITNNKELLRVAETDKALIKDQQNSAKQLLEALLTDVELAEEEYAIARSQTQSNDVDWGNLWSGIANASAGKSAKISAEHQSGETRIRSLDIELNLTDRRVNYRKVKITELETKQGELNSFSGWMDATWKTMFGWLKYKGWKVALTLFLIWLALRLALRVIHATTETILKATRDDNDDEKSQEEQRTETIADVFSGVAKAAAYAVAWLVAMEQVGINTGPILASAAILGLAISFGSQNLVRDVVNGMFILIENQYAVGDVVAICGQSGTVEQVNVRSTRIRQLDGTLHIIPNGSISSVANKTRDWGRAVCEIGVGYDSDLEKVAEIVNTVGEEMYASEEWKDELMEAPSYVGITLMGDSCVTVRAMAKVEPGSQWGATRELNHRLKIAFDEAGIDIPFPQRVVWTKPMPNS